MKIVIAAVIFGSSGSFVKYLTLPVTVITFFRMAIPAVIIFLFFRFTGHSIPWKKSKILLTASLLNAIRLYFYFMGYTYTTIGKAVILLYTWPVFAMIFSMIILKEKITLRKALLVVTSFAGVVLIYSGKASGMKNEEMMGLAAITLSAMLYSITVILFKRESDRFTGWETVFFQNILGVFLYMPFLFIAEFSLTAGQVFAVSSYGILIGVAGFGLFFSALKELQASTVSFLNYIEVISAIALGIILFDERVSLEMVLGGGLILGSALMVQRE